MDKVSFIQNKNNQFIKEKLKEKIIKKYSDKIFINDFPEDVGISTITITCHFDTNFDILNIQKYLPLNLDKIVTIKYDGDKERSVIIKKRRTRKKKKKEVKKKSFFNQITVLVKPNIDTKPINCKLFKNGSVQMTGAKSIKDAINALDILCGELLIIKGIIFDNKINKIEFVSNRDSVDISKIHDFKVCMINSDFNVGFKIDREQLFNILSNEKYDCKCDTDNHPCVDIKYSYKGYKKISIFIFQSGSVLITGAKHCRQILEAYKFIYRILLENYTKIKSIIPNVEHQDIRKYLTC